MPHVRPVIHNPGTIVKEKRSRLHHSSARCSCKLNCAWLLHRNNQAQSPFEFISCCQLHEIQQRLPSYLCHLQWSTFFDTKEDGFSLSQIYRASDSIKLARQREGTTSSMTSTDVKVHEHSPFHYHGGHSETEDGYDIPSVCLMVVAPRTTEPGSLTSSGETVIGFFTTVLPNVSHHDSRHFFGGKETFVFRFHHTNNSDSEKPYHGPGSGGLHTFHWVGEQSGESFKNQDFMICSKKFIGVGGGSHGGAAIYFDEELQYGTSTSYCETFGCSCLCGTPSNGLHHSEFVILRMVWLALGTFNSGTQSQLSDSCCLCSRSSKAHSCLVRSFEYN